MSQDQFGESTRRAFLGTAAVATTATAVTLGVLPTSETALASRFVMHVLHQSGRFIRPSSSGRDQ